MKFNVVVVWYIMPFVNSVNSNDVIIQVNLFLCSYCRLLSVIVSYYRLFFHIKSVEWWKRKRKIYIIKLQCLWWTCDLHIYFELWLNMHTYRFMLSRIHILPVWTWWKLFQKRFPRNKYHIYLLFFLINYVIWTTLSSD